MEERIKALIDKLTVYRDEVLSNYLSALDLYDPKHGSQESVDRAGLLHDIDRHITNLIMESKRIEAILKEATHV